MPLELPSATVGGSDNVSLIVCIILGEMNVIFSMGKRLKEEVVGSISKEANKEISVPLTLIKIMVRALTEVFQVCVQKI